MPTCTDKVEELSERMQEMSPYEQRNFKQIKIDVYRTQPEVKLFAGSLLQTMLIRILFVWSMRNPASAYVQGINDLAAPIAMVFLQGAIKRTEFSEDDLITEVSQAQLIQVEVDVFWCLMKLVSDI